MNSLKLYHEIHGAGRPLVLLHGALSTIETSFGAVLPLLAKNRRVLAVEEEAHGHTADLDRPLTFEQMAEDTVALLRELEIEATDIFGYSMGAGIALEIAIRNPEMVRKLVLASLTVNAYGFYPGTQELIDNVDPADLDGSSFQAAYAEVAPDPQGWRGLVAKVNALDRGFVGWPPEEIAAIEAPTLVIAGDSDIVTPEHAVELFRLCGGGVDGDAAGLPDSELAILPGTTHLTIVDRPSGSPRWSSAFLVDELGHRVSSHSESGLREYEALMGARPERALEGLRRQSPQLFETLLDSAFGGPLSRPELSRGERELATIAILAAAGGAEAQLRSHVRAALQQGIATSELLALCEHIAVYAGFPRALNASAVVDEVASSHGLSPPPQLDRVRLRDHETVVAQTGESGPAVLLVHALGLTWRMWEPVMPSLANSRRVYAYDIRSHGAAAGSPIPFAMEDAARDLIGILNALQLERAHVVGLSFGGGIAQTAAVRDPDRFMSLSLLATTDYPFEAFEARARSGEVDGMEAQVVPSLTRWFTEQALATNAWGVRYARECIRRGRPEDWAASWRAFKGLDVHGRLAGFAQPTLVLAGERDASTTPEIMRGIAERILGSTYRELPGTPHMQTLERPELVAEALDRFLPAGSPA